MHRFKSGSLLGILILTLLEACTDGSKNLKKSDQLDSAAVITLTLYKNLPFDRCETWISHFEVTGFAANVEYPVNLDVIKDRYRIANELYSCHTAVSTQGHIFEGDIPTRCIHQFLVNPPTDTIGLTASAMPVGSPGMKVDDFMPYQVLLIKKDRGTAMLITRVKSMTQQHQPLQQPGVRP